MPSTVSSPTPTPVPSVIPSPTPTPFHNTLPIAYDNNFTTQEDVNITMILRGEDTDGETLSYKILKVPNHGILDGEGSHRIYHPNRDYVGDDAFTYQVRDTHDGTSNIATVKIVVTPVNDVPIANNDKVSTRENRSLSLKPLLNDIDSDGDSSKLHIVSLTQPKYGKVLLKNEVVYYHPQSDFKKFDSLEYTIKDEEGATSSATISIDITSENDAPIAYNQTVETEEEKAISFELNATDPDTFKLNYTIIDSSFTLTHGEVTGTTPKLTYTPDNNYTGFDYILFKVDDGTLESNLAVVTILIKPLNDPPVANAGEDVSTIRGNGVRFDASNSYDIDGEILSYLWKEGNVTLSTQKTFESVMRVEGIHRVTLTVTDDGNLSDSDEKIVTINPCCQGCNYPDPTQTDPFN